MGTFSALLDLCAGNSSVTGEFPSQRPVTQSFDILFDLRLNKRLSKQSWGWWFEAPSCLLCIVQVNISHPFYTSFTICIFALHCVLLCVVLVYYIHDFENHFADKYNMIAPVSVQEPWKPSAWLSLICLFSQQFRWSLMVRPAPGRHLYNLADN